MLAKKMIRLTIKVDWHKMMTKIMGKRLHMKNKLLTVKNMALISVFAAIITVCSWICIPLGPVPFTLQTFAVFATAGILGTKRSLVTIIVYILLGMAGVPVFSQFKAGPAVLAGPTGGYVLGFICTVIIIGVVTEIFSKSRKALRNTMMFLSMVVGDTVCFMVGTVHFMLIMKMDLASSLMMCVVPYIVPDLIKMTVATIIIDKVKRHI